jgi:hypothetical protein
VRTVTWPSVSTGRGVLFASIPVVAIATLLALPSDTGRRTLREAADDLMHALKN